MLLQDDDRIHTYKLTQVSNITLENEDVFISLLLHSLLLRHNLLPPHNPLLRHYRHPLRPLHSRHSHTLLRSDTN